MQPSAAPGKSLARCLALRVCSGHENSTCLNRSVLERLLGARLVYERGSMARALSFEYLNRQLVWHELSELLLFLLPLLNVARIKAFVMARLPRIAPPPSSSLSPSPTSTGAQL